VVLNYTSPLLPDNMTMAKEEVLPSVRYGGRYWTIDRTFEMVFSLTI